MAWKKKQKEQKGYTFKPREYDRDEKIALQKIVTNIPVTSKLFSQELLVKATYNFVNKNIKQGADAAHNVNTTQFPAIFFSSYKTLLETTGNLVKVEPFWRFEGRTPTEQMQEITEKKDALMKGFVCDSFKWLTAELEKKRSASGKQQLFDEYQAALLQNMDLLGEENFELFKALCRDKLKITEE